MFMANFGTNFADRRRPLCRYSSLATKATEFMANFVVMVLQIKRVMNLCNR